MWGPSKLCHDLHDHDVPLRKLVPFADRVIRGPLPVAVREDRPDACLSHRVGIDVAQSPIVKADPQVEGPLPEIRRVRLEDDPGARWGRVNTGGRLQDPDALARRLRRQRRPGQRYDEERENKDPLHATLCIRLIPNRIIQPWIEGVNGTVERPAGRAS